MPLLPFSPNSISRSDSAATQRTKRLRLMDVQVVHHKVPLPRLRVASRPPLAHAPENPPPCASAPASARCTCPRHHIPAQDAGTGAMPDVLKLAPFDLAWRQRQARMLPFQRLDAGQFIGRDDAVALRHPGGCLAIDGTDVARPCRQTARRWAGSANSGSGAVGEPPFEQARCVAR